MTTKMISEETLQPQAQEETRITPRDLRRVFWRSFQMEFSWNYERQMNLAFVLRVDPGAEEALSAQRGAGRSAEAASGFFQYHAAYRHPAAGDHHGDGREKQSAEKHGCHCD